MKVRIRHMERWPTMGGVGKYYCSSSQTLQLCLLGVYQPYIVGGG